MIATAQEMGGCTRAEMTAAAWATMSGPDCAFMCAAQITA